MIYKDLPMYCTQYSRLGHKASTCGQDVNIADNPPAEYRPATKINTMIKEKPQHWTPKKPQQDMQAKSQLESATLGPPHMHVEGDVHVLPTTPKSSLLYSTYLTRPI